MPSLVELASEQQSQIIESALESKRETLANLDVEAFNNTATEFNKWQKEHAGEARTLDAVFQEYQTMSLKHFSSATMESFKIGFLAGLNAAFDIMEAKAMELTGNPPSAIN